VPGAASAKRHVGQILVAAGVVVFGAALAYGTALLPEARAVSLVKTLHADQDQGKFTQLLMQALSAGRQAIDYWQSVNAPPFRGKSMR